MCSVAPACSAICLIVSGGHTILYYVKAVANGEAAHFCYRKIGGTRDDAAGEAFDKVAKLLGYGYPGGPTIDRLAPHGDPHAVKFTFAKMKGNALDFSFSGLKTALVYRCRELGPEGVDERRADLAASFQAAVVGQLTQKLKRALKRGDWEAVALGGGVAANGAVRERMRSLGIELHVPPRELCTDNAAMIASAARFVERHLHKSRHCPPPQ